MAPELLTRQAAHYRPSLRVVQAVANEESIDPLDITTPLAAVIDPEALDTLVCGDDDFASLTFRYYGYEVTVEAGGQVSTVALAQ